MSDVVTNDAVQRLLDRRVYFQVLGITIVILAAFWFYSRIQVRFYLPVALATDWMLIWAGIIMWQAGNRMGIARATGDSIELQAGLAKLTQFQRVLWRYVIFGLGLTVIMTIVAAINLSTNELNPYSDYISFETKEEKAAPAQEEELQEGDVAPEDIPANVPAGEGVDGEAGAEGESGAMDALPDDEGPVSDAEFSAD